MALRWSSFRKLPEHKAVKNRVHLDIKAVDVDAAIAKVKSLGGSLVCIVEAEEIDPGQDASVRHND